MKEQLKQSLSPWDQVALSRPHVVPWTLPSGEIVAINLDEVPTSELAEDDKYEILKYQGVDHAKMAWLNDRVRPFVPCRGIKPLAGRKVNFWTGELVGKNGYHYHMVQNKGNGYFKLNNVLWHIIVEMEYEYRRFNRRFERAYNGEKGKYRTLEYQVHHRFPRYKGTSFGNSLLSVSLVPRNYHRHMHTIMDRIARHIERDSVYRGAVVVEVNVFTLRNFKKKVAHDPQKAEEVAG